MREIKFKAWDKKDKAMHEVALLETTRGGGFDYRTVYFTSATSDNGGFRHYPEVELMQFADKYDKNGNEIYESDVVEYNEERGVIKFEEGCFWISFDTRANTINEFYSYELEVIGNIHEKVAE